MIIQKSFASGVQLHNMDHTTYWIICLHQVDNMEYKDVQQEPGAMVISHK